jgi:serine-type D-Ala-D-Ala carboxypeptidase (penicillin-binding protein 5/6)
MPRRPSPVPVGALLCLLTLIAPVLAGAAPAGAQAPPPGAPFPAKAWILVDADSGRVLDAFDEHEALPPASTTKLMTALVATEKLPADTGFTVGPIAAAQPAMRIGMVAGERWTFDAALHALMLVSANDAAYALAEAASGNLGAFADDLNAAAGRYGMVDSHFADPAGFDDASAFAGGSRVSAYDLAIAARNVLSLPGLMAMAGTTKYTFDGPDGKAHVLWNHNKLLGRYAGATGLKTGYTALAGHTFVGTATRDGRTMIAVVLNGDDTYGTASKLMDKGFSTPADAPGPGAVLPPVRVQPYRPPLASTLVPAKPSGKGAKTGKAVLSTVGAQPVADHHPVGGGAGGGFTVLFLFVGSTGGIVVLVRQRAERRRRERAARRRRLAELRRQAYFDALTDDDWDVELAIPVQGQFEELTSRPSGE